MLFKWRFVVMAIAWLSFLTTLVGCASGPKRTADEVKVFNEQIRGQVMALRGMGVHGYVAGALNLHRVGALSTTLEGPGEAIVIAVVEVDPAAGAETVGSE